MASISRSGDYEITMDVGIVTPRYPPVSSGGGESSARILAEALTSADRVDSVTVLAFDGDDIGTVGDVTVRRLGSPPPLLTEYQNVYAWAKLRHAVETFDVVHAYNMELHPAVGFLASEREVRSCATLNSYHYFPKSVTNVEPGCLERMYELLGLPTTGRLMIAYMKRIDRFVALSGAIRDIYVEHGFPEDRIEVIPNMVDPSFSVPHRDRDWGGVRLLYVGSLTPNKGVKFLLEAVAHLPKSVNLRVVGTGESERKLRQRAEELGITDRVKFTGQLPYRELPQEYASADLFVHPGVWPEPMNRTVLEAMQAGLPVVCTDIGGPPEVMQHDELLCPPGDANVLAGAIERPLERNLEELGESNREYVYDYHSPDVIVPQIVDVYQDLLQESP